MRPPRPTVRRLMVVVAALAIALAAALTWHRSSVYRARAQEHAAWQAQRSAAAGYWRAEAEQDAKNAAYDRVRTDRPPGMDRQEDALLWDEQAEGHGKSAAVLTLKARHHAAMAAKYRRLASRPWLAAEPDPPEPE